MSTTEDNVLEAKNNLPEVTPTPPSQQQPTSSAQALKARLFWGEPAFTIIDVRERDAYNDLRIMGALPMPFEELTAMAVPSFEPEREIYVYGEDDGQTAQAAAKLREAGFSSISELSGGLKAWQNIGGPVEGRAA